MTSSMRSGLGNRMFAGGNSKSDYSTLSNRSYLF